MTVTEDNPQPRRDLSRLKWDKMDGLIPAVVQHAVSGQVLMLGYMNEEALAQTQQSNRVTFFSRSRQSLWTKGETSKNYLDLVDIFVDCDGDALLVRARPQGPTCHEDTVSCFEPGAPAGIPFLAHLDEFIEHRRQTLPEGSYTTKLFEAGPGRIAQKVGEEGVETALAAKDEGTEGLTEEAADLLYHLIVLLRSRELDLETVAQCLRTRHGEAG